MYRRCLSFPNDRVTQRLTRSSSGFSQNGHRRQGQALPTGLVRTRFAPSPTGYLHLGSLRTALYNFLLARATNGEFILRIEDTDQSRLKPDSQASLIRDLQWAGISWDEGPDKDGPYGPYIQSQRRATYWAHAEYLISKGNAYVCSCPLEESRSFEAQSVDRPSGRHHHVCSELAPADQLPRLGTISSCTIRLKLPQTLPKVKDIIYGRKVASKRVNATRGDLILIKSDGMPTYHFANVVDDHLMHITHVIRAAEWLVSTPLHLALYEAFDWQPPQFAHVGLLQNAEGHKLSKRLAEQNQNVQDYARAGILPEALNNFVALLGWSHKFSDDMLTMDDLGNCFDLRFTKGETKINPEKLEYLQRRHVARCVELKSDAYHELVGTILRHIQDDTLNESGKVPFSEKQLVHLIQRLIDEQPQFFTTLQAFYDRHKAFFIRLPRGDFQSRLTIDEIHNLLHPFAQISDEDWTPAIIMKEIESLCSTHLTCTHPKSSEAEQYREQKKQIMKYLRWAVVSGTRGPSLHLTMALIGRNEVLSRLQTAIKQYEKTQNRNSATEVASEF